MSRGRSDEWDDDENDDLSPLLDAGADDDYDGKYECIVDSLHLLKCEDAPPLARIAYDRLVMCDERDERSIFLDMIGVKDNGRDKKKLHVAFTKFILFVHPDKSYTPDILRWSAGQLFAKALSIYNTIKEEAEVERHVLRPPPPRGVKAEFVYAEASPPYISISWEDTTTQEVEVTCLNLPEYKPIVAKNMSEIVYSSAEYPTLFEEKFVRFSLVAVKFEGVRSSTVLRTVTCLDKATEFFRGLRDIRRADRRLKRAAWASSWQQPPIAPIGARGPQKRPRL